MSGPVRRLSVVLLLFTCGWLGPSSLEADEPAPPPPQGKPPAPAPSPEAVAARAERRVMVSVLKATGRVMLKYLEDKQDPEKASAYEDVFRALGGMLSQIDVGDPRGMAAAGMKAMLDLMPTMSTPKRSEVMRGILATFAHAVAEAVRPEPPPPPPGSGPAAPPAAAPQREDVGQVLLGAVADALLEEATDRALAGAQLDAPLRGVEGFRVHAVKAGSKAAVLGLHPGDRIVRFGDTTASWIALLATADTVRRRGDLPSMTVVRDGATVQLEHPAPTSPPPATAPGAGPR